MGDPCCVEQAKTMRLESEGTLMTWFLILKALFRCNLPKTMLSSQQRHIGVIVVHIGITHVTIVLCKLMVAYACRDI